MARQLPGLELSKDYTRGEFFRVAPTYLKVATDPKDDLYDPPRLTTAKAVEEYNALCRSVLAHGVRHNIECVERDGVLWVVDGRNRRDAAIWANEQLVAEDSDALIRVPVVVVKQSSKKSAAVVVTSNIHIGDNEYNLMQKIERMLGMGHTEEEIGAAFGRDTAWVKLRLKVVTAVPEVMLALKEGKIALTTAVTVASSPRDQQAQVLADTLKDGGGTATVAEVQRKVKKLRTGKDTPTLRKPKAIRAAFETLSDWLGGKETAHGAKPLPDDIGRREEIRPYLVALAWIRGEEEGALMQEIIDILAAESEPEEKTGKTEKKGKPSKKDKE